MKFRILTLLLICSVFIFSACSNDSEVDRSLWILISSENSDLEYLISDYAEANNLSIYVDIEGTQDILDDIEDASFLYDAIWLPNSFWLYMMEDNSFIKNSRSIFVEPTVFGITKSVAEDLGFTTKDRLYTQDILDAVSQGKLKFIMPSVTQTNSGASAYLGILSTLAGNPEVLTEEDIQNEDLKANLTELFKGVERSSGSDEFSAQLVLNGDYDAIVSSEAKLIQINKDLEAEGREPLYILYPYDGVSLSDAPFCYIDNGYAEKEEVFLGLQDYLLSTDVQKELTQKGRRAGYGGLVPYGEKTEFNPEWGIDTEKYISPIKYPSTDVILSAMNLYQTELRKPLSVVFCLDYSGSMSGEGKEKLVESMNYILTDMAADDMIQFAEKDKIAIIPFWEVPGEMITTDDGTKTEELLQVINALEADGGTNFYDTALEAVEYLEQEDSEVYNCSVILMSDGASTHGSLQEVWDYYDSSDTTPIPIFSITFGDAVWDELSDLADLSGGQVFDGSYDLVKAFKTVRGYN